MSTAAPLPLPERDEDWQRRLAALGQAARHLPWLGPLGSERTARPAAVLVPLLWHEGAWHLLFIRRARHEHDPHSGQVSFPGGRVEPQDPSPEAAALREAAEEIGLRPQDVRVLGRLPRVRTVTDYLVTPVVGRIPWPYPLRPAQEEVADVFTVPLDWLARPEHRVQVWRALPGAKPYPVFFFHPYGPQEHVIWGATARMVLALLAALDLLDPTTTQALGLNPQSTIDQRPSTTDH